MDILKIIETLQSFSEELVAYKMGGEFSCAVTEAVERLIEQGEHIADLENKLATVNGGWIPVSLGFLPERGAEIIACSGGVLKPTVFAYHFWSKEFDSFKHITHWMPMPELPKEVHECSR
jgi:hypothetical protein